MIVKNESAVLERCLDSVKGVFDEIIIADTGSDDNTKEIAGKYTDKIVDFKWCDDFSKARNFSFSFATCDYIMWLDADDVLEENSLSELIMLKGNIDPETEAVMMKYILEDGSFFYRERLIKKTNTIKWHGFVHEILAPLKNIIYSEISILHKPLSTKHKDPERNLKLYEKHLTKGIKLNSRDMYYYGAELYFTNNPSKAQKILQKVLDLPYGNSDPKINTCVILYYPKLKTLPKKAKRSLIHSLNYGISKHILNLLFNYYKSTGEESTSAFWEKAATLIEDSV